LPFCRHGPRSPCRCGRLADGCGQQFRRMSCVSFQCVGRPRTGRTALYSVIEMVLTVCEGEVTDDRSSRPPLPRPRGDRCGRDRDRKRRPANRGAGQDHVVTVEPAPRGLAGEPPRGRPESNRPRTLCRLPKIEKGERSLFKWGWPACGGRPGCRITNGAADPKPVRAVSAGYPRARMTNQKASVSP
jgi:hypothetical protein